MAPDSAIIAAGVGATFHLLRVVADLVKTATQVAKANDEKIETAKAGEEVLGASARRLSTRNFNGMFDAVAELGFDLHIE